MEANLLNRWENLENQKRKFEEAISLSSDLQLNFKPASGGWSMLQVLQHVVAIEKISSDYLVHKSLSKSRKAGGVKSYIRSVFLRMMLKSPFKFKAPAVKGIHPVQDREKQELLNQWNRIRIELHSFLEEFPEEKNKEVIFRHPLVGWLTMEQTLVFLADHITHHQNQLSRIRKSPGFP